MNESLIHFFFFFSVNLYIISFFPLSVLFKDSEIKFPSEKDILILTTSTFEEALKTYQNLAVLLYTPWSNYKGILSELQLAAASKIIKNINFVFAKIDVDYYISISEKYNIKEFPSMIFFIKGEKKEIYNTKIDKDSIIEWFYKRLIKPIHLIESINDIKEYQNNGKFNFIYFGKNQNLINVYKNFSLTKTFKFGLCKNLEIFKKYGLVDLETAVFYKPFDEPPYFITKNITSENLEKIIKENSYPLIYKDIKDLKQLYFSAINHYEPVFFFFRNSSDIIQSKEYDETMIKISRKYKGKIKFCIGDVKDNFIQKILNDSKIYLIKENFPTAIIYDYENELIRWEYNDFFDYYNKTNLEYFIQNWIDKKLKFLKLKSEDEPGKQEPGKVYKIVRKTFKRDVLDNILNVFVKFFLPNDTLCKEIESIYEDLALNLKINRNIRIAEYNLEKNDFDYIKIDHYPSLILFRAGHKEKNELIEYKGDKDVNNMIYFVLTNQAFPILEKRKQKEKK